MTGPQYAGSLSTLLKQQRESFLADHSTYPPETAEELWKQYLKTAAQESSWPAVPAAARTEHHGRPRHSRPLATAHQGRGVTNSSSSMLRQSSVGRHNAHSFGYPCEVGH